ncbi:MAG TPA: hypothetical protein VFM29_01420 [Vicinamibacteria bacterium]|nr:hypothetical protein [Vicinamibacteria bacterium]
MAHREAHLPPPRRRRQFGALQRLRDRLAFDVLASVLAALVLSAWAASVVAAYREREEGGDLLAAGPAPVSRSLSARLTDPRAKSTAYLESAAVTGSFDELRGQSGKLRAVFRTPGEQLGVDEEGSHFAGVIDPASGREVLEGSSAPGAPGIYKMAVELDKAVRPVSDLQLVTLVPFSEKKAGKIGLYYLGSWPYEGGGKPRSASYANPRGFVEVTKENKDTPVSEHFRIGQFLTKDQYDVWPKYVIIEPKLLDKLELAIQELKKDGYKVEHVHVMSGFRTPRYNVGGGNTKGRANLSRHMYGDGADVYVDNDRDAYPDDLNGDGRVDTGDAETFARAVGRVESQHPALVGGIGIYKTCCGHGPFTHVDTRGYRARWRGSGTG